MPIWDVLATVSHNQECVCILPFPFHCSRWYVSAKAEKKKKLAVFIGTEKYWYRANVFRKDYVFEHRTHIELFTIAREMNTSISSFFYRRKYFRRGCESVIDFNIYSFSYNLHRCHVFDCIHDNDNLKAFCDGKRKRHSLRFDTFPSPGVLCNVLCSMVYAVCTYRKIRTEPCDIVCVLADYMCLCIFLSA